MNIVAEILTHPTDEPFIVDESLELSYGEMTKAVAQIRALVAGKAISPKSVVALRANQDSASILTLLALLEMECSVLLVHTRWPGTMLSEALERVRASHILISRTLTEVEVQPLSNSYVPPSWATGASVIVATSGSTGVPKLALLSLSSLLASARTSAPACALTRHDRWRLSLPLFHVGGLGIVFRSLVTGSSISLTKSDCGIAEPATTHLSLVPTQLYRLLRDSQSRAALRQKRCVMLGGAPIGTRILREAIELGIQVMATYGLTEMGSVVTLASTPVILEDGTVSLGRPLTGRKIHLSAEGELLTRGETLFTGYITTEGLSLPLDEAGWFATGDIGKILSDGTLAITGRKDAQFISGGENINPEMIENALTSLSGIMAACVVPIPNDEFGQRPFAFVVSERAHLDIEEIREALRPHIPGFALPVGIQEAPRDLITATGKISRSEAMLRVNRTG
jgi:O-succinylbenzoic acid--CoA ligase